MPDQKISELAAITTIDNAADVLPIVDTSATTTKKVTPTQLKTSLALNNVDNTSDANKPISSATQTALDAKASTTDLTAHTTNVSNPHSVTKTQVGLSNVDNTSDLNKPISTATQTALNAKQDSLGFTAENVANKSTSVTTDQASNTKYPSVKAVYDWAVATFQTALGYTAENSANKSTSVTTDQASNTKYPSVKAVYDWVSAAFQATLVSGTNIKTINSTSLLGSGNISVAPASGIDATAIADGTVTSTEFQYINSLTSNAQTQIDGKQATLVSGTNIKTINSTSLLGSGDIVIGGGSPSGVSGAIQFSDGSAFASDAANLFWDDTNNRFGVGTNAPSATGHFKGSGSTSATTSLLVQNSGGSTAMEVKDNLTVGMGGAYVSGSSGFGTTVASVTANYPCFLLNSTSSSSKVGLNMDTAKLYFSEETNGSSLFGHRLMADTRNGGFVVKNDTAAGVTASLNASAVLQADSTTRGFLPPRMTNLQRTSISSPAVGLMVYCTDAVEGLYINKSTGWTLVI